MAFRLAAQESTCEGDTLVEEPKKTQRAQPVSKNRAKKSGGNRK